jgi:hypothetical protein
MGVDFTDVVDHRLDVEELLTLPDRLNAQWELPGELAPWVAKHVHAGATQWQWERQAPETWLISELQQEGYVSLDGPDGFHGYVCRHAIQFHHHARWWSFLYETSVRSGLEAACRRIARVLGTDRLCISRIASLLHQRDRR